MRIQPLEDWELDTIEPEYLEVPRQTEEQQLQNLARVKENARRGRWLGEGLSEGQFVAALEREPGLGCLKPGQDYDRVQASCTRQWKRMERRILRRLRRAERWMHWKRRLRQTQVCRFFRHML